MIWKITQFILVLQKTRQFQQGIFFVLLNPQPNGACFAGMNFDGNFNLENYSGFEFKFKAQASDIKSWKIVLKTSDSIDRFTSYQQDFEVWAPVLYRVGSDEPELSWLEP